MPFTVSHVVAVLPLLGLPTSAQVPAALVIGSMSPDLPYFVPPYWGADWSHSASGPVTIDLIMGLAVFAVWHFVLAAPLADLSPNWLRPRLPLRPAMTPRAVACGGLVGGRGSRHSRRVGHVHAPRPLGHQARGLAY